MRRRSYQSRRTTWLVPVLTIAGMAGFFAWQFDVIPIQFEAPETGWLQRTSGSGDASRLGTPMEEHPSNASHATAESGFGEPLSDPITVANAEPQSFDVPQQSEPPVWSDESSPEFDQEPLRESVPLRHASIGSVARAQPDPSLLPSAAPPAGRDEPFKSGFERFPTRLLDTTASVQNDATIERVAATLGSRTPDATLSDTVESEIETKLRQIDALLNEDDYLTAHAELSRLYWHRPEFREQISDRIEHTAGSIYAAPQPHYVRPYIVQPGDTLSVIAERYSVPSQYLARLNRVNENRIRAGQKLKTIKGPFSAVIDLSDYELTIHAHGYYVHHYKVGIGIDGTTPLGRFTARDKLTNPAWHNPDGGRIEADDPNNPLGEHWIGIGDGYGIHGTVDSDSVGRAESRGCIRMTNEDVAEVFSLLSIGSEVVIRR